MATLREMMAKKAASASPVIRASDDKAALVETIKITLDGLAPKIQPPTPEPRELGAIEAGERIPMDYPPQGATKDQEKWFSSLHSFESDLGVVLDPSHQYAWIAVRSHKHSPSPLLLHRLPLISQ